jgi:potassium channel subfamily K
MNDPGLDDAIADEAVALDSSDQKEKANQDGKLSDSKYPQAARWWFASTAYPLMAVCQTQEGDGF